MTLHDENGVLAGSLDHDRFHDFQDPQYSTPQINPRHADHDRAQSIRAAHQEADVYARWPDLHGRTWS